MTTKGFICMMRKKRLLISIWTLVLFFVSAAPAAARTAEPHLEAESAILMDMSTGNVLYEKVADQKMFPASTTKMITCILALEYLDLESSIIIDDQVAQTGGSSIGLRAGEVAGVLDLLYALMTESANDSAEALALAISGSMAEFVKLMNERARQFGAKNTNFVNPHGLHDPLHVTTARDLAFIAKGCMENETFRMLVGTSSYHMETTNKNGARNFRSTNRLLWDEQDSTSVYVNGVRRHCGYPEAIGIKTGTTNEALCCLVSSAKHGDTILLSVVLKSSNLGRFADSIALLDWGFANYQTTRILGAGTELGTVSVKRGSANKVIAIPSQDIAVTLSMDATESVLTTEVRLDPFVRAPVKAGQKIGEIALMANGTQISVFPAIAALDIEKGSIFSFFDIEDAMMASVFRLLMLLVIVLIPLHLIYTGWKRRQIRLKKQEQVRHLREKYERDEKRRLEWELHYASRNWSTR